jgi:hypothetical protein
LRFDMVRAFLPAATGRLPGRAGHPDFVARIVPGDGQPGPRRPAFPGRLPYWHSTEQLVTTQVANGA